MTTIVRRLVLMLVFGVVGAAAPVWAQSNAQPSAAQAPAIEDDPDLDPNLAQPDFTLINLPTTLRLPRFKSAFRVTHRFGRPLGNGTFGDLAGDLFGLDSGALIGLEYRFGVARGLQAGILRTSNKTIEFFGQYNIIQQDDSAPIGLSVVATVDGTDNFSNIYSPSVGVVVSRELGRRGALYVEPIWVHNANLAPGTLSLGQDNDTLLVGLGARLRVRPSVYVVAELIPRAGFAPSDHHVAFAIEKRSGGHVFQLNISDGLGNTMGQLAQGGTDYEDWYIGFNIARKFF
jgi:hypothetical protein